MNADGSGQTDLSNNGFLDFAPSWSPDGTKIAFWRAGLGTSQIFVMNADGTGQTNLSNNGFSDSSPAWGPLVKTPTRPPVGGTIIPIDTTALLVAGITTNAVWMVPTLGGIAGAVLAFFKIKGKHS